MKRIDRIACALILVSISNLALAEEVMRFPADRPLDCIHIKLELNVNLEREYVEGTATLDLTALRDVKTIRLNAVDFATHNVTLARNDGPANTVEYTNDGEHIEILLDEPLRMGDMATVAIRYAVDHPKDGLRFFKPSEYEPDADTVVWSQGESITNRYWFPCFDHPNERQTTELIVTSDVRYKVSSNGRLVSRREDKAAGTVTYHWLQDKPHVAYLVSMIVGEFHVEQETWRGKPVEYWVHPPYKDLAAGTFKNTKRMLDYFSDVTGIEYPWDRYAQICCEGFGGGMENTAATTLGTRSLHDERSLIDSDSDGLIAHELAHQWWGDLLTCSDWAHIWLNEGFASYFEALWDEHDLGDDEYRYNMYRKAERAMSGGTKRPIVDRSYASPGDMFDARAYPKGAWVLHMLRRHLGDDAFWKAIHHYGTKHANSTVETADFRKAAEEVTGLSLGRFFYDWTERPGHPELSVSFDWLGDEKMAHISVNQKQEAEAFHVPLTMEFRFEGDAEPVTLTREITQKETSFYYPLSAKPTMFRVDPEYAVLTSMEEKKGRDLWEAQLLHDPDPIARIRAAEYFGKGKSPSGYRLLAKAMETEGYWGVLHEIAGQFSKAGDDIARDALIAGLKHDHPKVRRACADGLSTYLEDESAINALRPVVENGDASYSVEAAAIRSFGQLEPEDAVEVLTGVLSRDSHRETIRSAALDALGYVRSASVIPVLADWTGIKRPREVRAAAISSLVRVTQRTHVDDETYTTIVEALTAALNDTGRFTRASAIRALGGLDRPALAKAALSKLESLLASEGNERTTKALESAIKSIRSGEPAQVQLADLRDELKETHKHNEELIDRIEKLEARLSAAPDESESKKVAASEGLDVNKKTE